MDTIPPIPAHPAGRSHRLRSCIRGMPAGTEQWVLGHPEALLELQRGYGRPAARC